MFKASTHRRMIIRLASDHKKNNQTDKNQDALIKYKNLSFNYRHIIEFDLKLNAVSNYIQEKLYLKTSDWYYFSIFTT